MTRESVCLTGLWVLLTLPFKGAASANSHLDAPFGLSVSVSRVLDATEYLAFCPIPFRFTIANSGSETVTFTFTDPFSESPGGFIIIAEEKNGREMILGESWHNVGHYISKEEMLPPRGLCVPMGMEVSWERYSPASGSPPQYGLSPGVYKVRAQLMDFPQGLEIQSEPIEITVGPPSGSEVQTQNALRSGTAPYEQIMIALEEFRGSAYEPFYLDFLARQGEYLALTTGSLESAFAQESIQRAAACRDRLKTAYPDWPTNGEGALREAGVRLRLGDSDGAARIMNQIVDSHPGKWIAERAQKGLRRIQSRDQPSCSPPEDAAGFEQRVLDEALKEMDPLGPESRSLR